MKKGVSPLIASVLLIAMTISAAYLIMNWVTALNQQTSEVVSNRSDTAVRCSSARITIDDVYLASGDTETGSARIIVKNTGFDPLDVNSAQLYNRTGDNFSTGFSPQTVTAGAIYTVYITNVSVPSCPADFSKVLVTSSCGGISATFDGAPKCL
jgi:flagellin-like protein